MAEQIAFDIITKLNSPLLQQLGCRWKYLDGLRKIVYEISDVLLAAEERSVSIHLTKDHLERLEDALYDADDLLDDIHTEALKKDLLSLSGNKLMKQVRLFLYGLSMGRKIKAITTVLSSFQSEAKMLNSTERDRPVETTLMTERPETQSFVRRDKIIGRKDDKSALLKYLLEFESEENVYIIPIGGNGGVGKTALAQLIYNNDLVKDNFDSRMWVCVSYVFDIKVIVANMIKSATNQAPDRNLEWDRLQEQLRHEIDRRKYLLVLDDIWNEEREKWLSLKELLMGGARGSRIIVTTRSMRVAEITGSCQPHVLKGLSDDNAWLLFKKIVFDEQAHSINPAFVRLGKQIVETCGGVPLVIRVIAGILSFKDTEIEWLTFRDNQLARASMGGEDDILAALKLSYDFLPPHLKRCFAYCRLYPKDHEIDVRTLVQFWIAQGFIKQLDPSCSLEDIGLSYIKDLFEMGFFQQVEAKEEYQGRETCKMHDLMHKVAESVDSILYSDSSVNEVDEKCRHKSIKRFPLFKGRGKKLFRGKKLRTLLHFSNKISHNMTEAAWDFRYSNSRSSHVLKYKILTDAVWDLIISNCRGLRVLKLDYLYLSRVPGSIHKLRRLRYLDLSSNDHLKILPHSICNILNLQVLKLEGCRRLEELPRKIEKLVNLTHLLFNGCDRVTHMPRGIGKLTSLQKLSQFVVDKDGSHEGAARLRELRLLNNLRGELKITNLGFVKNAQDEFKAANLKEKQHLQSLILEWSNADRKEDMSLEDLQPHPNLQKLVLVGWRGHAMFPTWLSLLTNLTAIEIFGPSKFEHLHSFDQLPRLQRLMILNLSELEYMDPNGPNGGQGESESFFPSLTSLTLRKCPNMKSWWRKWPSEDDDDDDRTVIGTSSMAFPCLSYLHIEDCPMTSMPLYPSLNELTLINNSSRPLMQIIQMNTTPSTSSPPLSNLKYLRVDNIPHLVSLPLYLVQLKILCIQKCSGLRSLFPAFQYLTSLERLEVRDCIKLELSADGIQIFQNYTSLRHLMLQSIPKCCHLPKWIQHLANLRWLYLIDLPNLTSLPDEMLRLTKLKELYIINNPQLNERCRKNIGADWPKIAHIPHISLPGTRYS